MIFRTRGYHTGGTIHTIHMIYHTKLLRRWYEGDEKDEEDVFHPSRGNVLFCAAADGWGFTVPQFARMYSAKFGFSPSALARALWGPYTLQMKAPKGWSTATTGVILDWFFLLCNFNIYQPPKGGW